MKTEKGTVELNVKNPEGEEKKYVREYDKIIFENIDDVMAALSEKDESKKYLNFQSVIDNLNYAVDLKIRAGVRSILSTESASPDKFFNKQVESFMKLRAACGKPVTEDQARRAVKALSEAEIN